MTVRDQYEKLLREIDALPPQEQIERLLRFISELSASLTSGEAEILRMEMAARRTKEGNIFAEVVEGEIALRHLRP